MRKKLSAGKLSNSYVDAIDAKLYADTPKAVFAAIAASLLLNHGVEFAQLDAALVGEWVALHANGLVPQRPRQTAPWVAS